MLWFTAALVILVVGIFTINFSVSREVLEMCIRDSYKGKGEQITVPIWCAAATDGTHKILVDTGIRDINEYKKSEPGASQSADQEITTALKNIMGWSADDVDMVINTHLHCDHCGCNYKFKNAKFYIQKKEWEAAFNPSVPVAPFYDRPSFDTVSYTHLFSLTGGRYNKRR